MSGKLLEREQPKAIWQHHANLSPAEQKVHDYLVGHALDDTFLNVSELALKAGVSDATIVRFCKKIGFSGFSEFKKAFLKERLNERSGHSPYSRITDDDDSAVVLTKVFALLQDSLASSLLQINKDSFSQVIRWLAAAEMVEFYGHGGSGHVAKNAAIQFQRQGIRCVVYTDPLVHTMAVQKTAKEDVVVGISHTGETPSVVQAIKKARKRGIKTCVITNFPHSALARSAELVILTATNSPVLLSDAGVSRISQLATLDAIGVAVSLEKRRNQYLEVT